MKFSFDDGLEAEKVYDDAHKALVLGDAEQLGRTGAGGSVYQLPKQPDYCVKVFNAQDLANKTKRTRIVANLKAMLEMSDLAADPRLTWPVAAVYDKQGGIVGYVMRRIPTGFKTLKSLFGGVTAVKRAFPNWTRRELAVAAANLVNAVAELERRGVFVADFNPENFLVNAKGEVRLIDCDSFMFYGRCGEAHTSDMFFADNAAPEILREPRLAGQPRSSGQSAFSAAVLAFQLLMLGQHPFSYVNALDGRVCGTPRENILAGMCPLGRGAPCEQAPRWYAPWSWLTGTLQCALVTTFRDGYADPSARTPLDVLLQELEKYIFVCGKYPRRSVLMPTEPKRPNPPQPAVGFVPAYGPHPRPRLSRSPHVFHNQQTYRAFGGGCEY